MMAASPRWYFARSFRRIEEVMRRMRLAISFRWVRCEPEANTLEANSIGAVVQESVRGNTMHRREVTIDVVRKSKRLPSPCCVRASNQGVTSTNRGTAKTRSSHAPCEYLWRSKHAVNSIIVQVKIKAQNCSKS